MKLVGISGKIGTGKTYIADLLVKAFHPRGMRMSFADPVKREVAEAYNIPLEDCYSAEGKAKIVNGYGKTVREILQWWGTDYRRAADPDYWTKAMGLMLDRITAADVVVIDDVRFPDEARFVLDRGGFMARLDPYPGWKPGPHADHVSELALDDFEYFSSVYAPDFGGLPLVALHIQESIRSEQ